METVTAAPKKKINWVNVVFLLATPVVAAVGLTLLIATDRLKGATWILALAMAVLTGLSITAGYHRLFTHRSYEANFFVKLFFLLFGAASFENSAKNWCADHREHHQHVDHEQDPYNIKKGFFHAHMGWIFYKRESDNVLANIPDLLKDPLIRFQDRYYYLIAVSIGFLMPMGIASLWGDPWGGLLLAGVARVVYNHHATFLINSLCHFVGCQPYSDQNSARDSWWIAFFTYGEGYHNFHHAFQADYRNGFRKYHWDPAKWTIRWLQLMGLARNLRRVSKEKILLTRLRMEEKYLLGKVKSKEAVTAARLKLEEAYTRFCRLKEECRALKKQKMGAMREQLLVLKAQLRETKLALKEAKSSWTSLCKI